MISHLPSPPDLFLAFLGVLLCAALIVSTCSYASPPASAGAERTLIVENQNWETANVHVFCDGTQERRISQIATNASRRVTIRSKRCDEMTLAISFLGSDDTFLVNPFLTNAGDCWELRIMNALSQSFVRPCVAV